jgi:Protein of unknown function (DUF2721)
MHVTTVAELIPILQTAIGPVILISGVGLLLLTMTNRLARILDRARALSPQLVSADEVQALLIDQELCVLWRRALTVRLDIALVSSSALAAALLIIVLFLTAILRLELVWLIATFFVVCMAGLISGLVAFIVDVNLSLDALTLELRSVGFTRC